MNRRHVPWKALFAAAFLIDWAFTAFTWLTWNKRPGLGQDSFLIYALQARESGILTLGNDHPLYPLILSLWASRLPAAFTWSKLFSLAWGGATLAAVLAFGGAEFGAAAAVAGAVLLSVNWVFLSLSMSLRAEVLLPLLFFVSFASSWRAFRGDARWFLVSGAAAGLATLAKGTGTLLALCWAGAFLLAASADRRLWRKAPWFLAGYGATAGLLWWANASVLGDPFYNYSSRHAFWLDTWWEAGTRPLAEQSLPGFVARHGWLGIPLRELKGMLAFAPVWLATLAPAPSYPMFHLARWPLAAGAAWCLWRARRPAWDALARREGGALFAAAQVLGFFAMFSWYHQVSPSERFVAPLSPMIYLLAAAAAVPELRRLDAALEARWPGRRALAWALGLFAGFTLFGTGLKAAVWGVAGPFENDRPEPCYEEAMAWAAAKGGTVLYGPSADLTTWPLPAGVTPMGAPEGAAPADLGAWLRARRVKAAVVDWDMARLPFFDGAFSAMEGGGVRVLRLPPGWREAGRDRIHEPPHMVLVEDSGAAPPKSYNRRR